MMNDTNEKKTAADTFSALCKNNTNLCGDYDTVTHSMVVFMAISPSCSWSQFQRQSEAVRDEVERMPSVIHGIRTFNPAAPKLRTSPRYAIKWEPRAKAFLPAPNITLVLKTEYLNAKIEACACANLATRHFERTGRLPDRNEIGLDCEIFYSSATPGQNVPGHVRDLLSRFNTGPTA